jgi:hypothetical protein
LAISATAFQSGVLMPAAQRAMAHSRMLAAPHVRIASQFSRPDVSAKPNNAAGRGMGWNMTNVRNTNIQTRTAII